MHHFLIRLDHFGKPTTKALTPREYQAARWSERHICQRLESIGAPAPYISEIEGFDEYPYMALVITPMEPNEIHCASLHVAIQTAIRADQEQS